MIGIRTQGRPWFGDMVKIFVYGRMVELGLPISDSTGDGRDVQISFNLAKSLEGGIGDPLMLPHGPKRTEENWNSSRRWINEDIIQTRTVINPDESRYTEELRLLLKRGVEISNGIFWETDKTDAVVGFNLSIDAMDTQAASLDGLLRHENW